MAKKFTTDWIPMNFDDEFPDNAVLAGYDFDDSPIFVGRAEIGSENGPMKFPANLIPSKRECLICNLEVTETVESFEVLIADPNLEITWSENQITEDSVAISNGNREKIFIGRVSVGNGIFIGNIPEFEENIYIPDRNKMISKFSNYEVLTIHIPPMVQEILEFENVLQVLGEIDINEVPDTSSIATSNEKSQPLDECNVCMANEKDSAFMSCGHFCICKECAQLFRDRNDMKCPVCRKDNTEIRTFYRS